MYADGRVCSSCFVFYACMRMRMHVLDMYVCLVCFCQSVQPNPHMRTHQVLKREVLRTQESGMEKGTQYRTLLIQAIHACATKFADVAERYVRTDKGVGALFFCSCVCGPGSLPHDNWQGCWHFITDWPLTPIDIGILEGAVAVA